MNRLTRKIDSLKYYPNTNRLVSVEEIIYKLGKLEDLEENVGYSLKTACEKARKYDDKETSMKPLIENDVIICSYVGDDELYLCPKCGSHLSLTQNYCDRCGQKLDWSDENE